MQDDKAGEYMSKAFIKFCDDCGILRRHTVRNRPQQNGVAERANRTMSDDITAMLAERVYHLRSGGNVLLLKSISGIGSPRLHSPIRHLGKPGSTGNLISTFTHLGLLGLCLYSERQT